LYSYGTINNTTTADMSLTVTVLFNKSITCCFDLHMKSIADVTDKQLHKVSKCFKVVKSNKRENVYLSLRN